MEATKKPAIFLDRDGTLVEEVNFLSRVEHLHVFDHTAPALRRLKSAGFLLIVVTNQSGIGRGLYTESDMHAIHREIQERTGYLIDGFYFCPHMPDAGCGCRKPKTGMFLQAETDHPIDIAASWTVGDKILDIEAGINAGTRTVMVRTGYGSAHLVEFGPVADLIVDDLHEAAEMILARSSKIVL